MTPRATAAATPPDAPDDTSARPRARKGEGDRTRAEILEAAEELLMRSGSEDAVSIRAVADQVGLTPPAIYRHFPDKAHLIFEVCSRRFDVLDEHVVQPMLRAAEDPVAALRALAEGYVRFGVEHPEHYRIMFMGHADHTPELYADERILETGSFGAVVPVVQAGIDQGLLRDDVGDALLVTWTLWAALHGLVAVAVAKPNMPGPPFDAQLAAMVDVLLRGIVRPAT
ncbi:MAG TPA: TetR/AcrR family transcriptional regulator [Aquihabitans sp.]|nr:TetR/AcrR family transcriptional regulator [Aquihabitans sp.]